MKRLTFVIDVGSDGTDPDITDAEVEKAVMDEIEGGSMVYAFKDKFGGWTGWRYEVQSCSKEEI